MAEDANQLLPRAIFFLPQCAAYVRQQQQRVWHSTLPKRGAAYHPAGFCTLPRQSHDLFVAIPQDAGESQFIRAAADGMFGIQPKSMFSSWIDQAQHVVAIECQDGGIHRLDDAAQQCCRFQGAQSLRL